MARVYVGNLPDDVRKSEIEDLFKKYGPIRDIEVKLPRGSTCATGVCNGAGWEAYV